MRYLLFVLGGDDEQGKRPSIRFQPIVLVLVGRFRSFLPSAPRPHIIPTHTSNTNESKTGIGGGGSCFLMDRSLAVASFPGAEGMHIPCLAPLMSVSNRVGQDRHVDIPHGYVHVMCIYMRIQQSL